MNIAKGFTDDQKRLSRGDQLGLIQTACKASYSHDFIQSLPLVSNRPHNFLAKSINSV
jgi:ATP-binding cassette subfamily B (MDR/TAP) protein 1